MRSDDSAGVIHGFVGLAISSRLLPLQGVVGGMISCADREIAKMLEKMIMDNFL